MNLRNKSLRWLEGSWGQSSTAFCFLAYVPTAAAAHGRWCLSTNRGYLSSYLSS